MSCRNIRQYFTDSGRFTFLFQLARCALIVLLTITITGCGHTDQDNRSLRPVNVVRIKNREIRNDRPFPGEVHARIETALSFREAGKLINRSVDIGDFVHKGQLLAKLDPADFKYAAQDIKAQLITAEADRDYNKDDINRYRELFEQNVISRPELDRHETLYTASRQKVAALEAQLGEAVNRLTYTDLFADRDGVVTALEAEAGQVVSPGQSIIKLAQVDEKEVHVDIPEHRVAELKKGQDVNVSLWVDGEKKIKSRIREIAAAADPVSRTYRVKVNILEGTDEARLGMTATVWIPSHEDSKLTVPLSAVFTPQNQPDQTRVWLVDESTSTVKALPVQIGKSLSDERVEVRGLEPGQLVVSAGANRLIEGQNVRLPQNYGNGDLSEEAGK